MGGWTNVEHVNAVKGSFLGLDCWSVWGDGRKEQQGQLMAAINVKQASLAEVVYLDAGTSKATYCEGP